MTARTMTTYSRADGDDIGDGYGWVVGLEWFEDDYEPTELIEEVWSLVSSKHIIVNADKIVCAECGSNKAQGCNCD